MAGLVFVVPALLTRCCMSYGRNYKNDSKKASFTKNKKFFCKPAL